MKLWKRADKAKIYMVIGQINFMVIGYLVQIFLSKSNLSTEEFSNFQFVNFLTNFLNTFIAISIPITISALVSKNHGDEIKIGSILRSGFKILTFFTILEFILILIISTIFLNIENGLSSKQFLLISLSGFQVIFFGFLNLLNAYLIARRRIGRFTFLYIEYMFLKSFLILLSAAIWKDAAYILSSIILAEIIQICVIAIVNKIKITGMASLNKQEESFIARAWVDVMFSNLLIFGFTNLGVVITFFGIKDNFDEFNIFTLIFPWALISYYLISSVGNIYLVDSAEGIIRKDKIGATFRRIVASGILITIVSLVAGGIFFKVVYTENFNEAMKFLLLFAPSGILISILSILFSILQGMQKVGSIRIIAIISLIIYIGIIVVSKDLSVTAGLTSLTYLILTIILFLRTRNLLDDVK